MTRSAPAARVRRAPERTRLGAGAAALLAVVAYGGAGCGPGAPADPRPLVAVSVPPQAWVLERLAGDRVQIEIMVPPGASPVTHEPTIRQLRRLESARLYVAVGHPAFPFESAWLGPLLDESPDLPVLRMADDDGHADGADPEHEDPHVWVTPRQVRSLAVRLVAALAPLLPDAEQALSERLAAVIAEIDAVDALLRARLSGRAERRFLVLHAAWGHLADEYGLEQVPIERGHKAPDAHAVGELIASARAAGARVLFVQPQFDASAARLVAREIGARVVVLDPLARDWATNMRSVADALAEGLY